MKRVGLFLIAILLSTVFVLGGGGCTSSGGKSSSSAQPTGADPTTIKFRHFLGKYIQENWNATNTNEGVLSTILDHTYTFASGRKTADYLEYFILEKREIGRVLPLNIKSITIIAGSENIVLDLQNLAEKPAFPGAPVAPSTFANGVLSVSYPNAFGAGESMPRIAVAIPENKRATIANASTVSVKIVLNN